MTDLPTNPQLHMLRPHLRDVPEMDLPEGYALRTFQPDDGPHWSRIIGLSFLTEPEKMPFDPMMRQSPAFQPERIFFVCRDDEPLATASAWYLPELTPDAGTVHYVGTLPGHTGRRLGYWAVVATLHQMRAEGRRRAWLSTDDFRLPAIKVYLNLGFQPLLVHENQRQRWPAVFEKLGLPHLTETFADTLAGPLWERPDLNA